MNDFFGVARLRAFQLNRRYALKVEQADCHYPEGRVRYED